MIPSALQVAAESRAPFSLAGIRGLDVEVHDLAAARAFYEPLFGPRGGWQAARGRLTYQRDGQSVTFVERARPRVAASSGQHQAYTVAALPSDGGAVERWREDHPDEREPGSYLLDPSGNRVQLVLGEGELIDHAALELHDLELAEVFYANILGGEVDYVHGWAMDDYAAALAEPEDGDDRAPWTRRYDVRYWDKVRIRRPNIQLFVRFGSARLGLILAGDHRQQPPPEQLRGTPGITLSSATPAAAIAAHLDSLDMAYEADGSSLFLRDPAGNFVTIECQAGD